jgi:hypothetical protein
MSTLTGVSGAGGEGGGGGGGGVGRETRRVLQGQWQNMALLAAAGCQSFQRTLRCTQPACPSIIWCQQELWVCNF